jgi:hypothetical protein
MRDGIEAAHEEQAAPQFTWRVVVAKLEVTLSLHRWSASR